MKQLRQGQIILSIIIPAKNEEKNIEWVLTRIKNLQRKLPKYEIIVVDGHSTDKTREVAKKFGCRVIFDHGKGKGDAIRTAAKKARGEILLFIDADGSHDPKDIPKLITPIIKDKVDLAIGSRMLGGSEELYKYIDQYIRLVGSVLITVMCNYRFKTKLTDLQNGFRAIKKEVFEKLNLKENITTIEQEMVIKTLKKGYKVVEVSTHEYERRSGESHISIMRYAPRYVYSWVKYMLID